MATKMNPSDFGFKGTLLVGTDERLESEVGYPNDVSTLMERPLF